jgi:Pyruvate/2-oxoglutarate dehydrogenase complex, dihydrolipoamide dehydrogenase (E3) component, and related enzymes
MECAGLLNGLGYEATVMARSIPLRGFDQQMVGLLVDEMMSKGVKFFVHSKPDKVEKIDCKYVVTWTNTQDGTTQSDSFDTVLFAIGRRALTKELLLENAGVKCIPETGKIVAENEQTNVKHIYAVGDVLHVSMIMSLMKHFYKL